MKIEIINTGTELLLGDVVNTHLAFLGQQLFPHGLRVERQISVPDGPAIRDALLDTFQSGAEVVIVTGGLGPTSDDITREIAAEMLGRTLATDATLMAGLKEYYAKLSREVSPTVARQALVPAGATVIPNHHGTAPGLYLPRVDGKSPHLFLLPGPPRELRPMFAEQVVPMITALRPAGELVPEARSYRMVNIGESNVEALVGAELAAITGLEVGYCARVGEVDLRVIGTKEMLERADKIVQPAVAPYLLSVKGETLEEVIVARLGEEEKTLAVAESCTGGLLAHRLTNVSGAGKVFLGGFATYAIEAKVKLLGVPKELIDKHDAVSAEVASAMAAGACRVMETDYALSTTGYAGPEGGTREDAEPVGTVYVALAMNNDTPPIVERHFFQLDRESFKVRATQAALDLLRRKR